MDSSFQVSRCRCWGGVRLRFQDQSCILSQIWLARDSGSVRVQLWWSQPSISVAWWHELGIKTDGDCIILAEPAIMMLTTTAVTVKVVVTMMTAMTRLRTRMMLVMLAIVMSFRTIP